MKKQPWKLYKFIFGFVVILSLVWSCSNDPGKIGYDLLPSGDLVQVFKDSTLTSSGLRAFTISDGNLRTDETPFNLLGTYNDPVFGKTTADFALQFRIDSFPEKENNIIAIDSLVLYLLYNEIYGDTVTQQNFKVYEMASDLSRDAKYYQDADLKSMAKGQVLADFNYLPRYKDSLNNSTGKVDTVLQTMRIHLNQSLANKLMYDSDSTIMSSNTTFVNFFKGLYIQAGDLSSGGSIMRIKSTARGSRMVMYYRTADDTVSLKVIYKINSNSARVNRFMHDYSNTSFASNLGNENAQDTLLYLQSAGGLKNKIFIPNLTVWAGDGYKNFAINKAELIFNVDPVLSDTARYNTLQQLALVAITKSKAGADSLYYPSDYSFSPVYFGGYYNKSDLTYRFNIANHLQEILDGKKENLGFYLETNLKNSLYGQIVLKSPTSKKGVQIQVTYSKYK